MNHNELSDAQKRSNTITTNEVVHAGTASKSHMRAANTKTAIIRCSTTVKPVILKKDVGTIQQKSVAIIATDN